MQRPPLGSHVSVAGGVERAFERGAALDCETVQIFVKNASRWQAKPLEPQRIETFRAARRESTIGVVAAHAAYLINLAAGDPQILADSRRALGDELDRCVQLGVDYLVVHPGAHVGGGEQRGLATIVASLHKVRGATQRTRGTRLLLENTAGQGTVLGYQLEQLAQVLDACPGLPLGVCIDTCHAFAAGYAIHEADGYEAFWQEVDSRIGIDRVGCLHLNDSQKPFASCRDRHANIGQGEIGIDLFRRLVHDPRLQKLPMILETPYGEDGNGHHRDLELLRSL